MPGVGFRRATIPRIDSGVSALPFDESVHFNAPPSFGPYRVLHQIGSGVLGPVFRTYEPQRDRLVAVKAFKLDLVPEDVDRFAESLRRLVAAGLPGRGIVPMLDAGVEGSTAYLAMDYVAGETLDVAFRHLAPAPLARALPILLSMAQAIDAAWAAGVGHGALHPRDVFFRSGSDEVLVTGVGVVPALEAIGFKPPARRPYAAPERIAGGPADIRADVYSLGAIAYELLTRRRPVGPGEQDGEFTDVVSPEHRALLRRVLGTALAVQPGDRFPSATAFVDALAEAEDGTVSAVPVTTPTLFEQIEEDEDRERAQRVQKIQEVQKVQEVPQVPQVKQVPEVPEVQQVHQAKQVNEALPAQQAQAARQVPEVRRVVDVPAAAPPPVVIPRPAPPAEVRPERPEATRDRRPLPPAMFASVAREPEAGTRSRYPWVAMVAVAAAGLTVGGVGGYELGLRRAAPAAVAAPASSSADTEVKVPPVSAPTPPAAVPVTSPPATPPPVAAEPVAPAGAPAPSTPTSNRPATRSTSSSASDAGAGRRGGARTGAVLVDTRPSGAKVIIDGKASGMTPVHVSGLSLGTHFVRVELAGYKTVTRAVTVKAGPEQPVRMSLERRSGTTGRRPQSGGRDRRGQ